MESFLTPTGLERRVSALDPLPVASVAASAAPVGPSALGALNAALALAPGANGTLVVQVTGTFVAGLQLQGSLDGVNFVTFNGSPQFLNLNTGAYTNSITAPGIYQTSANGLVGAKIIATSYTSGSATVTASLSSPAAMVALDAALPAGGNKIGSADVASLPSPTTPSYAIAATTNTQVAKASAGNLYYADVFNNTGSVAYLHLFNKATAPTLGTDTPQQVIPVPAGFSSWNFGNLGLRLSAGIAIALTANPADLDNAPLLAAGGRIELSYV